MSFLASAIYAIEIAPSPNRLHLAASTLYVYNSLFCRTYAVRLCAVISPGLPLSNSILYAFSSVCRFLARVRSGTVHKRSNDISDHNTCIVLKSMYSLYICRQYKKLNCKNTFKKSTPFSKNIAPRRKFYIVTIYDDKYGLNLPDFIRVLHSTLKLIGVYLD